MDHKPLRVAVFGGSFNPPHVAHLLASVYALSTAPIDRVLVIPVFRHPFAKELAPFEDRLEMCRLGLGWIPGVEVSTVERELGGESLTLRTVEHLAAEHPEYALRLLIGSDVLADLPKWHRFDQIAAIAPPLVLGRSGITRSAHGHEPLMVGSIEIPEAPLPVLPQVSSTEIREAIAAGRIDEVRAKVPAAVLDHIARRGLYGQKKR